MMAHVLGLGAKFAANPYVSRCRGGRAAQQLAGPGASAHGLARGVGPDGLEGKRLANVLSRVHLERHARTSAQTRKPLACGAKTLRGPSGAVGHRRTSARRVAEAVMAGRAQPDLGQSPAVVACAAWSGVPLRHHLATMQHAWGCRRARLMRRAAARRRRPSARPRRLRPLPPPSPRR